MTTLALTDNMLVPEARTLPIEDVKLDHAERRYWTEVFRADTVTVSRDAVTRILKPKAFRP